MKKLIFAALSVLFFYFFCFTYIPAASFGCKYDAVTGEVTPVYAGVKITHPLVFIARLPLTAVKVKIPSSSKVVNQKFVVLVPEHVKDFVEAQGFEYYGGFGNVIGQESELAYALVGYAYSGEHYSFLRIPEKPSAQVQKPYDDRKN